jgi:hypothetical protein
LVGSVPRRGAPDGGRAEAIDPEVPATSRSRDAGGPLVFISYSSRDGTDYAMRLRDQLGHHGIRAWLCLHDMDVWRDFTAELEQAIEAAGVFVVCITSGATIATSYVRKEITFADRCGKPIAVARFAPITPPISVVNNTYFDFHEGWDAAFARLLTFCRSQLNGTS